MKKITFFFSLFSIFTASAQVDSVLFGISIAISGPTNNPVSSIYLTRVNTNTGVLTNAANLATTGGLQVGNSTIDSYNKIFYFNKSGNTIVGVSLYNGSVVSSQSITNVNASNLHNMYFNCGDTTIYALARTVATASNPSSSSMYLAKVNPNTGVVTNISPNSIGNSVQLNNVTIDPYNKIYYYFTQGSLVGLNLTTGTIVTSATLTCPTSTVNYLYSGIFYNRSDSTLYGLARAPATVSNVPSSASMFLAKITPAGIVSIISPTSVAYSFQVANAAIDPYTKVYHFVNGNKQLIGVSLLTGLTVSSPTITNPNGGNSFLEMNYNCNFCPEPVHEVVASIKKNIDQEVFFVYPNPASDQLFVELKKQWKYEIMIRDITGRLVLQRKVENEVKLDMNITDLVKGMYIVTIITSNQKVYSQKFLVSE